MRKRELTPAGGFTIYRLVDGKLGKVGTNRRMSFEEPSVRGGKDDLGVSVEIDLTLDPEFTADMFLLGGAKVGSQGGNALDRIKGIFYTEADKRRGRFLVKEEMGNALNRLAKLGRELSRDILNQALEYDDLMRLIEEGEKGEKKR